MKSREERRQEEREYRGDLWYEVWRHGGNPDRVSYDDAANWHDRGVDARHAASAILQAQRPHPVEEEMWLPEEQYPDQEFPDEPQWLDDQTCDPAVRPEGE